MLTRSQEVTLRALEDAGQPVGYAELRAAVRRRGNLWWTISALQRTGRIAVYESDGPWGAKGIYPTRLGRLHLMATEMRLPLEME